MIILITFPFNRNLQKRFMTKLWLKRLLLLVQGFSRWLKTDFIKNSSDIKYISTKFETTENLKLYHTEEVY